MKTTAPIAAALLALAACAEPTDDPIVSDLDPVLFGIWTADEPIACDDPTPFVLEFALDDNYGNDPVPVVYWFTGGQTLLAAGIEADNARADIRVMVQTDADDIEYRIRLADNGEDATMYVDVQPQESTPSEPCLDIAVSATRMRQTD